MSKIGILLKWKKPSSEATYNTARIYRSDSETGTFTAIASQTIADNSYYDETGTADYWYKVDFYDTVTGVATSKSIAIQGNANPGYCTVDDVRIRTNITTSQVTDTQLAILIEMASADLNADISLTHEDERVSYINATKVNDVNGVNLTYYTKNYPLADKDNSYSIGTGDVEVYTINSDGQKNSQTVTQVRASDGQFKLDTPPGSDVSLWITYDSTNISVDPPHRLVKTACIYLTAAMAYSKINVGKAPRFRQGPLTVFRDTTAHKQYMKMYHDTLRKINEMVDTVAYDDAS